MFGLKYKQSLHYERFLQDEECTAQTCWRDPESSRVWFTRCNVMEGGGGWRRGQRERWRVYIEREKEKRRDYEKRQSSRSHGDGWGERIWMRGERGCFSKGRLINDLPKMPVTLRVPSWLLIWKPMLLMWGFGRRRTVGSAGWAVDELSERTRRSGCAGCCCQERCDLILNPVMAPGVHVVLSPAVENLPENDSKEGIFLFDIMFDDACQVE